MDDSDKKEFAILYYSMGEYYDKKVSTDLLKMFFTDLCQFTIDQVKEGARVHRLDSKHGSFFPKPPDIARHIDSQQLTIENRAKLAWIEILGEVVRVGSHGSLRIKDKQALAALKAICTWKELCGTDQDKMQWIEKRFVDTYETYDKTPLDMLPDMLPGRIYLDKHKAERLENKDRGKDFAKLLKSVQVNK